MSDKEKQSSRIPFENLEGVSAWNLPKVSQQGASIKSAAREALERTKAKKLKRVQQQNESVEDVPAAKKPKPLTAEELSRISEDARKEGYDSGYKEGLEKGETEGFNQGQKSGETKAYQQTRKQRDDEIQRLRKISDALLQPMQTQQQLLEDILVEMAVALAKQLLMQEIQQSPAALYKLVNHALSALPAGAENITVHLNGEDAALLKEILPSIDHWKISEDKTLTPGGCRLSSNESLVDFTVESRVAAFLEDIRQRGDVSSDSVPPVESYREAEMDAEPDTDSSAELSDDLENEQA